MSSIRRRVLQAIGIIGVAVCAGLFIDEPSFPTPDKLIVFLFFVFLIMQQAIQMLKRLGPFVALLLVYESFRGIAHTLNDHVHYTIGPTADHLIFGRLPTATLQHWLWHGKTSWYDIAFYIPYMLFFVLPLAFAILVWKTRVSYYWQVVTTYLVVFFGGFLTFLLYPTAPPWLASQNNYIEPIARVSSSVWYSLGIHDFPSLYDHIAPNPVAAVPSLHAACATLLSLFIFKLYGKRWGVLSLMYPALIYVGVVYEGEHYAFDVFCGMAYAIAGYSLTPYLMKWSERLYSLSFRFIPIRHKSRPSH